MKKLLTATLILSGLFLALPAYASVTPGSSNANSLNNGLVGYWTFDGSKTNWSTGKTSDSSSQGNTGSLISLSTTTSPVVGKVGQAITFD